MQEGGKIAVAVSVTFMSGVVVGWLLNTYTRKVHQASPGQYCVAAAVGVPPTQPLYCLLLLLRTCAGLGKGPVQHAEQGQEHLRRTGQRLMMLHSLEHPSTAAACNCVQSKPAVVMLDTQLPQPQCCSSSLCPRPWQQEQQQQFAGRPSPEDIRHTPAAATAPIKCCVAPLLVVVCTYPWECVRE